MNQNERPEGYLLPPTRPLPEGMRPFIARRPPSAAANPNHLPPLLVVGEVIPLPAGWCYRCWTPGHLDHYGCWPEIRPVTPKRGAQLVAMAARAAAGVPLALASWTAQDEILILDVVAELVRAADAATDARIRRGERDLWALGEPKRPDVGMPVDRFGRAGMVVEAPEGFADYLVPVTFEDEPSIVVGFPQDEWSDLVPLELVE